jgi:mRNA-degrading endonuclease RelE of RelBE toxin-antitoxin system
MYILSFEPGAYRIFKKFSIELKEVVLNKASLLQANPLAGEPLQGKHRKYRSLHFGYKGVQYRIVYQVLPEHQKVVIQLADKRENIYKRLEEMGI